VRILYVLTLCFSVYLPAVAIAAPSGVISQIQARAAQRFPGDYSTQKYEIRIQIKAYDTLEQLKPPYNVPYSVFYDIKKKAAQQFPDDYSTQLYEVRMQMKSYSDINRQHF